MIVEADCILEMELVKVVILLVKNARVLLSAYLAANYLLSKDQLANNHAMMAFSTIIRFALYVPQDALNVLPLRTVLLAMKLIF